MESQLQPFQFLCLFAVFVLIIIKLSTNSTTSRLPPGPRKLPLIGNLHNLIAGGPLTHKFFRDLAKKHGPLMHLQLGQVSTVVISSAETAAQVMKNNDIIFASRPQVVASKIISYESKNIAFAPYGEYWREIRKICTLDLLSTKRVQSFRSLREEVYSDLVKSLSGNADSQINLTEMVYSTAFGLTARAAFGKVCKDQQKFIALLAEIIELGVGFNIADIYPSIKWLHGISGLKAKLERLHEEMDRILEDIIMDHIHKDELSPDHNEDLVDVLLRVQKDGNHHELTLNNIKAVILDIFSAGSETSATTIDWAMAEMLKNPSTLEKAQQEVRRVFNEKGYVDESDFDQLKYLRSVIKETLRFHPPLPLLLPRLSSQKCEINGYELPANTQVFVNAWAIGRDPRYWEEPECFKPERFLDSSIDFKGNNFEYIPFGAGRRICPGMLFGMANVELPLALLLYHFDWKLPNGMKPQDLDMTETFGLSVRRKLDMHVVPVALEPFQA